MPEPRRPPPPARPAAHGRAILRLGVPLVIGQLSTAGFHLANTLMAGHLSSATLAAVAVGASYYAIFANVGTGALLALSPLVAHAYGAGEERRVGEYARHGAWVAAGLALVLTAALLAAPLAFRLIGTDPSVVPGALDYLHGLAAGLPAALGFLTLRYVSDGLGRTRPMMVISLVGLAINVLGNWLLMYGHAGLPALGAAGCGIATAVAQWAMLALMFGYVRRHPAYRPYAIFAGPWRPAAARLGEIARLGFPISGAMVAESALFAAAGLMLGTISATTVAAHQIALNYASFTFTIPVALAAATTIHVGHALGRGDLIGARRGGFAGIGICAALMAVSALCAALGREAIAAAYSPDPAVDRLAALLLLYVAVFQVADGLQVGAMGALRGFKDTRVPLFIAIGAYWLAGFPVAFVAGIVRGGGPAGVWSGLIAGLVASACALNLRFAQRSRRAQPAAL
ncbi:MAG: MATE family efflux transporter [Proteobacteria bacterium]|nr:MATE family efflux transporter [Pseudomonadota bacterium]